MNTLPMHVLKRKLKQVASGLTVAALFLVAGMAAGGPVAPLAASDAVACAPDTAAAPAARPEPETAGEARLAARAAMRMPYFSFGKLLPRTSVLGDTVGP